MRKILNVMNYDNSACSGLLRWAFIAYGAAHGVTGSGTVNVNNALFTLYPSYLAHAVPPPLLSQCAWHPRTHADHVPSDEKGLWECLHFEDLYKSRRIYVWLAK